MEYSIDRTMNDNYSIDRIVSYVHMVIDHVLKSSAEEKGMRPEEQERAESRRNRLGQALKNCMYGSKQDKAFVKEYMRSLLEEYYEINTKNINLILPFDDPGRLSTSDKFDILLHMYKRIYGLRAFSELVDKYSLDQIKQMEGMLYFCITTEEIEQIYKKEQPCLCFEDKFDIVLQRVYSIYKGYGCVDDLLDMQIDGLSGGVSGLPESFLAENSRAYEEYMLGWGGNRVPRAFESVWVFFRGKSMHMRFLSFGSYDELQRICQNIYKFGHPGQLSKVDGYKVNKLMDGSRVVVMRPDFCESWAFFIRKFDIPDLSLQKLITGEKAEMVIELIRFLVKGSRNIAVTGAQGTGKTTLLNAMVEHIYQVYTLRILEMAFELHARKRFPFRNVLTVQETDTVSGQQGLDILKKTDGIVTIVGEVASDPVASYMIQTAQVASKFTLFSHHAKTFSDLVLSLRNSLLREGWFSNEKIAEEQIVRVVNFDIHLEKDINGRRYIERITECLPVSMEEEDSPEAEVIAGMARGRLYASRNIIIYDTERQTYCAIHPISNNAIRLMQKEMMDADKIEFRAFCVKLDEAAAYDCDDRGERYA